MELLQTDPGLEAEDLTKSVPREGDNPFGYWEQLSIDRLILKVSLDQYH